MNQGSGGGLNFANVGLYLGDLSFWTAVVVVNVVVAVAFVMFKVPGYRQ